MFRQCWLVTTTIPPAATALIGSVMSATGPALVSAFDVAALVGAVHCVRASLSAWLFKSRRPYFSLRNPRNRFQFAFVARMPMQFLQRAPHRGGGRRQ